MKPINTKLNITLIGLALAISLLSLAFLISSPTQASAASIDGPESLCGAFLYTTYCNAGPCSPSPNQDCPGGWMYFCGRKLLDVYQHGEIVGSSTSPGWFCSTTYTCYTTC